METPSKQETTQDDPIGSRREVSSTTNDEISVRSRRD